MKFAHIQTTTADQWPANAMYRLAIFLEDKSVVERFFETTAALKTQLHTLSGVTEHYYWKRYPEGGASAVTLAGPADSELARYVLRFYNFATGYELAMTPRGNLESIIKLNIVPEIPVPKIMRKGVRSMSTAFAKLCYKLLPIVAPIVYQQLDALQEDYSSGSGICYRLDLGQYTSTHKLIGLMAQDWQKHSGYFDYPVPGVVVSPVCMYHATHDLWDRKTEYGRNRWELVQYLLDFCKPFTLEN